MENEMNKTKYSITKNIILSIEDIDCKATFDEVDFLTHKSWNLILMTKKETITK